MTLALDPEDRGAGPRLPERWLRLEVSRAAMASVLSAAPIEAVARVAHGDVDHVIVGSVERRGPLLVVRPWGRRVRVFVDLLRVVCLHPLPRHTYDERREVRRRQARGEPAAVLPPGRRPQRRIDFPAAGERTR